MYQNSIQTDLRAFSRLLVICCLVTFGCYFTISMRLPVVPLYATGFGISTAQIGVINAVFYLMAGLLALPSGSLSDRFGRKRLAISGTVIFFVGMLLLFVSRSFWQLVAIYLLLGVGIAVYGPPMMSWVSEIAPRTHLGRAYGWYTTAVFCGIGMGAAAGGVLAEWLGYRPVFLVGACLALPSIWVVNRVLPYHSTDRRGPGKRKEKRLSNWRSLLNNFPLMGCWIATLGLNTIAGVFYTFMPLLAHNTGLESKKIGIVYLVQSICNALSRIPFGMLSDRLGWRKYQVMAGAVMATLSIAGLAVAQIFPHYLVTAMGLGMSLSIAFTPIGALIVETTDSNFLGTAMGGYNSAIYFGLMAGSMGFGPLIEDMGFVKGFLLAGMLNLIFVILFTCFTARYSKR